MPAVPENRIRAAIDRPVRSRRACILYWMHSHRRAGWNFALQRAVELCRQVDRPLLVVETLFCDTPHASERLHAFILEGMAENIRQVRGKPIGWVATGRDGGGSDHRRPVVPGRKSGEGRGSIRTANHARQQEPPDRSFALDGQDPNSYSGIFWCLGRYDRARGPERPIFGKVRYMSSQNTARKHSVKAYLDRYGP